MAVDAESSQLMMGRFGAGQLFTAPNRRERNYLATADGGSQKRLSRTEGTSLLPAPPAKFDE
jgi:hypothetical protein